MKLLLIFLFSSMAIAQTGPSPSGPYTHGANSAKPAVCSIGALYQADDGVAGQNLYTCTAANTWALLGTGAATAGNIAGGSAGQYPYQSAPGVTGFRTPNAANGPLVLDANGNAVYSYDA